MRNSNEFLEKMATGDMIELQIIVFFIGIVLAMGFVFFIGRSLLHKKPEMPIRMDKKPQKSWKSFCKTK